MSFPPPPLRRPDRRGGPLVRAPYPPSSRGQDVLHHIRRFFRFLGMVPNNHEEISEGLSASAGL